MAAALLAAPHAALALSCKDAQNESIRSVIALDKDIFVSTGDIVPGKLLWRSFNYTVSFRCVDDYEQPYGESAYLYWDPVQVLGNIHPSIEVGVTYQSVDYKPTVNGRVLAGAATTPPSNKSNCTQYWNKSTAPACATSQVITVTFSVYIKATGASPPPGGQITDTGTYDLFQVDGVANLNAKPDSNFRAAISGLERIRFIACNPEITVVANGGSAVQFGRIAASGAQPGAVARSVPFAVEINMSGPNAGDECHGRSLVGSFSTSHTVIDKTTILPDNDSGFGIVMTPADHPLAAVPMNTAMALNAVNNFIASLKWLSNTPRIGPFQASATLDVSFR
ncbi:fimbrial protein [Bordetella sp. BOR01]|uniref:fimbrial protein n=1 Tax=Bordetella sp. BOR01 TaxID=2854779 RepID=UPI0021024D8F|nr:fimbrial protein [Bordetella sp. BOR01]